MTFNTKFILTLTLITLVFTPGVRAAENGDLPYPKTLLQDLESKDETVRLSAVQAIKPYRESESLNVLLKMVMEDPNPLIRLQAVGALWYRGNSRASKTLEKVLVLDKDREVRLAAAGALGDVGIKSTSSIFLINTIQSTKDMILLARCIRSLGRLQDHSSTTTVMRFLAHKYPNEVRGTAAEALGHMADDKASSRLISTLEKDPDNTVRSLAARALGRIGSQSGEESLTRTLLFDDSDIVRYRSAEALGNLRLTTSIYQAFIDGLRDPDKRVRFECMKALSSRLKKNDVGAVAELLTDDKRGIRELAHQTLSRRGIVMERIGDRYRLVE